VDSGASATPTPSAPRCGPTEFGAVEVVTLGAGAPTSIWSPALSADGYTLYFAGANSGAVESLFRAARNDHGPSFGNVTRVPSPVPSGPVGTPWLSADGLSLYFYATQASGTGERDLYVSSRANATAEFGIGIELTSLNSTSVDHLPWLTADELTIVYKSQRLSSIGQVLTANRAAKTDAFSAPTPLASLNTGIIDISRPALSADGLRIYFSSSRSGGHGREDIWYAERSAISGQFATPKNLDGVNTSGAETQVTLSFDAEELMFVGLPAQQSTLYRAVASCP